MVEALKKNGLMVLSITSLENFKKVLHEDMDFYKAWLLAFQHGELSYLEKNIDIRNDPSLLLPSLQSIISIFVPYLPPSKDIAHQTLPNATFHPSPLIASYAQYKDYHVEIKKRVDNAFSDNIHKEYPNLHYKTLVDSSPFLEHTLARMSSTGFIGKNTLFIHKKWGSFIYLAEILINLPLEPYQLRDSFDKEKTQPCGPCRACQTICPTGALDKEYQIDAKLCLSYWSIEHKGAIPTHLWPYFRLYYFGCDRCQTICPHNRDIIASVSNNTKASSYQVPHTPTFLDRVSFPLLFDVATMDNATYNKFFRSTPLARAKRHGLMRNALISLFYWDREAFYKAQQHIKDREKELHPVLKETFLQAQGLIEKEKKG